MNPVPARKLVSGQTTRRPHSTVAAFTRWLAPLAIAGACLLSAATTSAATIAHYRFEDGVDGGTIATLTDSVGSNSMTAGGTATTFTSLIPVSPVPQTQAANTLAGNYTAGNEFHSSSLTGALATTPFLNFTIEVYVQMNSLSSWQSMVGRDDSGNPGQGPGPAALFYLAKSGANNGFRVECVTKTNTNVQVNSSFVPSIGTWYHVAAVGNAAAGTLKLYVNGNEVGSTTGFTGLFVPTAGSSTAWSIGRGYYGTNPGDWFNGYIDEVRFSDTALTPAQFLNYDIAGPVVFTTDLTSSTSAVVGQSVTLTTFATGAPAFQWEKSVNGGATWTPISGATSASYTLNPVAYADNNVLFRVVGTNGNGSVASSATTLSVTYPAPTVSISVTPGGTVRAGTDVTLAATASGLGTLTYQWSLNGTPIGGATGATLPVNDATAAATGSYSVTVTDPAGLADTGSATSTTVSTVLHVLDVATPDRAIGLKFVGTSTQAPWSLELGTLAPADAAGFLPVQNWNNSATASQVNTQTSPLALKDNTGSATTTTATWASAGSWGPQAATGTIASKTPDARLLHGYIESRANTGAVVDFENIPYLNYDVYVYLAGGHVGPVGQATINDDAGTTRYYRLTAHDQYTGASPLMLGNSASVSDAQSAPTATFVRFANVTGASLRLRVSDVVTNQNAGGISGISIVNTTPAGTAYPPLVTTPPVSVLKPAGGTATFSVAATNANSGGVLSYQWQKNGVNLPGETAATLTVGSASSAATGDYTVVVTEVSSGLGSPTTASATASLVVVDSARSVLINGDLNTASTPTYAGHGILRADGTQTDDNFGSGDTSWNGILGAAGTATRSVTKESTGLTLPGVTFTYTDAGGVEDNTTFGAIASSPAVALSRDYLYTDNQGTPITARVAGLDQFAGHRVTLLVYAYGKNSTALLENTTNDTATVTLAALNNDQGLPAGTPGTIANGFFDDAGRNIEYNNFEYTNGASAAYVRFEGVVATDGSVAWTLGADADGGRIPLVGFQLLVTDEVVEVPLTVVSQPSPATRTVMGGLNAAYTFGVIGSPAPAFQWQKSTNGGTSWNDIDGADSATLSLVAVGSPDAARYRCIATRESVTMISDVVELAVEVVGDLDADGYADGPVLLAGDAFGANSFNTSLNWSDAQAPVAGRDYVVWQNGLRTPTSGDHTFAGDRLILTTSSTTTANLVWKTTGKLSFPELYLDGALINQAAGNGTSVELGGAMYVARASELWANNGHFVVSATVSGPGQLLLSGANNVSFSGAVSLDGNLNVTNTGGYILTASGSQRFVLGAAGITNAVVGSGPASLQGAFVINTTSASTVPGSSWTLLANTGAKTFGAGFTVTDFTSDAAAAGSRKWTKGIYQFDEATATVTVQAGTVSGIESWRQTHFSTTANTGDAANTADPDADGLVNLLEYALDTDPTEAGASPVTAGRSGSFLTLTFNHVADDALVYTIEASGDLATWNTVHTYPEFGASGTEIYTDTVALSAPTRRFLRLVVTVP